MWRQQPAAGIALAPPPPWRREGRGGLSGRWCAVAGGCGGRHRWRTDSVRRRGCGAPGCGLNFRCRAARLAAALGRPALPHDCVPAPSVGGVPAPSLEGRRDLAGRARGRRVAGGGGQFDGGGVALLGSLAMPVAMTGRARQAYWDRLHDGRGGGSVKCAVICCSKLSPG